MTMTSIDQLPQDTDKNYKRTEKKVYAITIGTLAYIFYGDGQVSVGGKAKEDSSTIITGLSAKEEADKTAVVKTLEDIKVASVKEFIRIHPKCFDLSKFDSTTVSQIDALLIDGDKKSTLQSMVNIGDSFWNGYTLGADEIALLTAQMGNMFDESDEQDVFHSDSDATHDKGNDYVGLKKVNGVNAITRHGDIGETKIFEVDGTGTIDDERFDSIEAFFLRLGKKGVVATEKIDSTDITETYKNRFDSTIVAADLTENVQAIENDKEKNKTFASLLNLDDAFWGTYKLTLADITAFKSGMAGDVFDYRTGSETVFHEYTSDSRNDYNTLESGAIVNKGDQGSTRVFEVDGTGTIDDERFDSVNAFFVRLKEKTAV